MRFVWLESLSRIGHYPNVRIISKFDVSNTIHQFWTFGVCTWCKAVLKFVSPLLTSTRIRYSANIGLLLRLFVMEATQKPILPPWAKKHKHGLKNMDKLAQSL